MHIYIYIYIHICTHTYMHTYIHDNLERLSVVVEPRYVEKAGDMFIFQVSEGGMMKQITHNYDNKTHTLNKQRATKKQQFNGKHNNTTKPNHRKGG